MKMRGLFRIVILCGLLGAALVSDLAAQDSSKEDELFFVAQKAFEDGFYDVSLSYLDKFLSEYPQTAKRAEISLLRGKCLLYQAKFFDALKEFQSILDMPDAKVKDAALFWTAEVHFKGKDYKLAESNYQKLLSEFPNSEYQPYAYYSLGWSLFEQARFQEAIAYFEKLLTEYPNNELIDEASFKKAEALYSLKQFKEASEGFSAYIDKFPTAANIDQTYFYIAESEYYQGMFDEALKNYSKAIELTKDNKITALADTGLGWSYLKLKKYADAQLSFQEAQDLAIKNNLGLDLILLGEATLHSESGDYPNAVEVYDQIITTLPQSELLLDAYLGKANALYQSAKEADAIPVYEAVIAKAKEISGNDEVVDKAYFGLAWVYLKLGMANDAIKQFQAVIERDKSKINKVSALVQLGDVYQDKERFQEALEAYDTVLAEYPESFYSDYAQYQEGITLLKLDKIDAATIAFQSLGKNFPRSKYIGDSGYFLALAYFKKGDFASAKAKLEEVINELDNASSYRQEAMFLLGMTQCELGEHKDAVNIFRAVIKNFTDNQDLVRRAEYEIANCFYRMGEEAEAVKKFKIISYRFALTDVAADAMSWLGNYYIREGQYDSARKYFQKITEDFSGSEKALAAQYQLAKSYYDDDNLQKAKELFEIVKNAAVGKLSALASLDLADIISQTTQDKELVAKAYQDINVQYPNFSKRSYTQLAKFYSSVGSYDKAIESLNKALEAQAGDSDISDSQIQFDIAQALEEKGDLDKAIELYLKITYIYPKDALATKSYLRVARIFENRGNWEEAKKTYQKILDLDIEESKFAEERLQAINDSHNK